MTKLLPPFRLTSPEGSGVSLNRRFFLYSSRPITQILAGEPKDDAAVQNHIRGYNTGMGRMRIKKKDAVIPFRETMAYRMILAGASLIVFITALLILVGTISTNTTAAIASGAVGVAAA